MLILASVAYYRVEPDIKIGRISDMNPLMRVLCQVEYRISGQARHLVDTKYSGQIYLISGIITGLISDFQYQISGRIYIHFISGRPEIGYNRRLDIQSITLQRLQRLRAAENIIYPARYRIQKGRILDIQSISKAGYKKIRIYPYRQLGRIMVQVQQTL